ncbi:hypothetical protein F4560_005701 [Saccharothrix ecbatanensis]|uniref:Uncharacterized protein n=1 Tax=Saccharothrix ecbatanensis TaxID=1105145 RepID=A0A7W9M3H5_9PSEU|nr:hypothetical protein [Saccharothrix ecbatanensis]MBB5805933.1 hypothetical protein [Saccharothrix ecbatanensis]
MTDLSEFRRVCHAVALSSGGRVVEFRIADCVTPNFHQAIIAYRDRVVAVVCTRHSALMAVAEPRAVDFANGWRDSGPLTFVDAPRLMALLADMSRFRLLTPDELNGEFDAEDWPEILAYDIKYWRPANLGEALFNHFD